MDTNRYQKLKLALAAIAWLFQAAYILSPFDLLPDFIPLVGWLDDTLAFLGLLATLAWMVQQAWESGWFHLPRLEREEKIAYEPIPPEVLRSM